MEFTKSTNGGINWNPLSVPGAAGAKSTDLEMDPTSQHDLYAGFLGLGVFKTTDGGTELVVPLNPGIALPPGCSAATGLPNPTTNTFGSRAKLPFTGRVRRALKNTLTFLQGTARAKSSMPAQLSVYKSIDGGDTWTQPHGNSQLRGSEGSFTAAIPTRYDQSHTPSTLFVAEYICFNRPTREHVL